MKITIKQLYETLGKLIEAGKEEYQLEMDIDGTLITPMDAFISEDWEALIFVTEPLSEDSVFYSSRITKSL